MRERAGVCALLPADPPWPWPRPLQFLLPSPPWWGPGCAPGPGAWRGRVTPPARALGTAPPLPSRCGRARPRPAAPFKNHSRSRPLDQTSSATRRPRRPAAMAGKGWQDLKQQVEGTAQEAGEEALGARSRVQPRRESPQEAQARSLPSPKKRGLAGRPRRPAGRRDDPGCVCGGGGRGGQRCGARAALWGC